MAFPAIFALLGKAGGAAAAKGGAAVAGKAAAGASAQTAASMGGKTLMSGMLGKSGSAPQVGGIEQIGKIGLKTVGAPNGEMGKIGDNILSPDAGQKMSNFQENMNNLGGANEKLGGINFGGMGKPSEGLIDNFFHPHKFITSAAEKAKANPFGNVEGTGYKSGGFMDGLDFTSGIGYRTSTDRTSDFLMKSREIWMNGNKDTTNRVEPKENAKGYKGGGLLNDNYAEVAKKAFLNKNYPSNSENGFANIANQLNKKSFGNGGFTSNEETAKNLFKKKVVFESDNTKTNNIVIPKDNKYTLPDKFGRFVPKTNNNDDKIIPFKEKSLTDKVLNTYKKLPLGAQNLVDISPVSPVVMLSKGIEDAKQGDYKSAVLNTSLGLLGSIPLKNSLSNFIKNQTYKAINPVGYGVSEKLKEAIPNLIKYNFDPKSKIYDIGSKLTKSTDKSEILKIGQNRSDSFKTYLGLDQEFNTFEKLPSGKYRINPDKFNPSSGTLSWINKDLQANLINKSKTLSQEEKQYALETLTRKQEKFSKKIETPYGGISVNEIKRMLSKDNSVKPWQQHRFVEKSKNKDFTHSVYDADENGIMGSFRWDLRKTNEGNIHFQSNDTWDLNPWDKRGRINLKHTDDELKEMNSTFVNKLKNIDPLKIVGGKKFDIENNFIVDPNNYKIISKFKQGGLTDTAKKIVTKSKK